MPGFDASGPRGMGSGAGWGRGPCGAGLRRGGGRTLGRGFWPGKLGYRSGKDRIPPEICPSRIGPFEPPGSPAPGASPDEVAALKRELDIIQQRLTALENSQQ